MKALRAELRTKAPDYHSLNAFPSVLCHKGNTKNQKNNTMDKKNNEKRMKQWIASCWIVSLAQQCRKKEHHPWKGNPFRDLDSIKIKSFAAVLNDSAALIEKPLTIPGCFSLLFSLLKLAIKAKKKYHHYHINVVVSASQTKEGAR